MSIPQLTIEEVTSWLEGFHEASATLDANYWLSNYFASDVILRYANMPPIEGYDAVLGYFKAIFPSLAKMKHIIESVDYIAPTVYQRANIEYLVKGDEDDGQGIHVRGMLAGDLVKVDGAIKIKTLDVYLDPSELLTRM